MELQYNIDFPLNNQVAINNGCGHEKSIFLGFYDQTQVLYMPMLNPTQDPRFPNWYPRPCENWAA